MNDDDRPVRGTAARRAAAGARGGGGPADPTLAGTAPADEIEAPTGKAPDREAVADAEAAGGDDGRGSGAAPGRPGCPGDAESAPDPPRLALEEERDFLLRSLDDLEREHDAGDVDDADYEALRDDYTARAADVLRRLAEPDRPQKPRRGPSGATTAPGRRRGRAWVWVGLVAVLAVVAGVAVAQSAGRRTGGASLSGEIRQSSRDLLLAASQATGDANASLQAGDADAALASYRQALQTYDQVLELSPANAEALTYKGWLLHQLALLAADPTSATVVDLERQAADLLDQAIAADPAYPDARVFRAILARNAGDLDEARRQLDAVDPADIPPFMQQMVDNLRAQVAG